MLPQPLAEEKIQAPPLSCWPLFLLTRWCRYHHQTFLQDILLFDTLILVLILVTRPLPQTHPESPGLLLSV